MQKRLNTETSLVDTKSQRPSYSSVSLPQWLLLPVAVVTQPVLAAPVAVGE